MSNFVNLGSDVDFTHSNFVPSLYCYYKKPYLQMQQNLVLLKVKAGVGKFYKVYFTIVFTMKILMLTQSGSYS